MNETKTFDSIADPRIPTADDHVDPAVTDIDGVDFSALREDGHSRKEGETYTSKVRTFDVESGGASHEVAIKTIKDISLGTRELQRSQREVTQWTRVHEHPHVVWVLDHGEHPKPWIAMERLGGETLGERRNGLESAQRRWTAWALASAVEYAHSLGVAHFDIHPGNVLFQETPAGTWDIPKLADWEYARLIADYNDSLSGGAPPPYSAPEQGTEEIETGFYTDVYQLGIVVYELLTGENPIPNVYTRPERPDPPSDHDSELRAIDETLQRALTRDHEQRCDSGELAAALGELFADVAQHVDIEEWRQFRGGASNIGHSTVLSGPSPDPEVRWSVLTGGPIRAPPVLADDIVYVTSFDGNVRGCRRDTGEIVLNVPTWSEIVSSPAVAGDSLYVCEGSAPTDHDGWNASTVAFDRFTGEKQWETPVGDGLFASPTVADSIAYVGSDRGGVVALDADTGEVLWRTELRGDYVAATPAVARGRVCIGCTAGYVYSIDAESGEILWDDAVGPSDHSSSVYASPAIRGSSVYVVSDGGHLSVRNVETGDQRWFHTLQTDDPDTEVWSSPLVCGENAIFGATVDGEGVLASVTRDEAEYAWIRHFDTRLTSSPVSDGERVYVGVPASRTDDRGGILAFDISTGDVEWTVPVRAPAFASPALGDGTLFVGDESGRLYAID